MQDPGTTTMPAGSYSAIRSKVSIVSYTLELDQLERSLKGRSGSQACRRAAAWSSEIANNAGDLRVPLHGFAAEPELAHELQHRAVGRQHRSLHHLDAPAKADGRWETAYAPMRSATAATLPEDLLAAIQANARARKTFKSLSRQNLFALAFRTNSMKTAAGRARKIEALVSMLARGETLAPQSRK
jgi:Bacteriocin-protection, YdeI or OmpD-Associated